MKRFAIMFCVGFTTTTFSLAAFAETVKKADLPALKGGKVATADKNPIPYCFAGDRAKLSSSDPLVTEWVESHPKHDCAGASTLYVCRAGARLSVRCE